MMAMIIVCKTTTFKEHSYLCFNDVSHYTVQLQQGRWTIRDFL